MRFFNSPNVLANFTEHTRTLRLYPRFHHHHHRHHHPYHYDHQKDLVFVFDLSIFQTSCSFPNKLLPPRSPEKFHICVKACPDTGDITRTAMFSIDHENHCQAVEFYAEWTLMPSNVSYQVSTKWKNYLNLKIIIIL